MPIKKCRKEGNPGYKYGDSGKCYTYKSGSESSRKRARNKAREQGQAIKSNQGTN